VIHFVNTSRATMATRTAVPAPRTACLPARFRLAGARVARRVRAALCGALLAGLLVPAAASAVPIVVDGIPFNAGEAAFADEVVFFPIPPSVTNSDPSAALGIPDGDFVSIGTEGELVLRFTDNSVTTSGTPNDDLYVFEGGSVFEEIQLFVSTDGASWIHVGNSTASTTGFDLDAFVGSGIVPGTPYTYVRIVDVLPEESNLFFAGADIEGVGAITSGPPVPEPGVGLLLAIGLTGLAGSCTRWRARSPIGSAKPSPSQPGGSFREPRER